MHFKYIFLLFTYLIAASLSVAIVAHKAPINAVEKSSDVPAQVESTVYVPETPVLAVQKPTATFLGEATDGVSPDAAETTSTSTFNTPRSTPSCTPTALGGPAVSSIRLHLCQASLRFNLPTTTASFIEELPSSTTVNSNLEALATDEIKTPLPRRPVFPGATAELEEQLLRDGKIIAILFLAHTWLFIYGWLIYWGQPRV